ncbi:site-specific integrase [Streptomyces sp. NPDC001858]
MTRTHTFRHSRATDLINAGVPIHVVMRCLGHLTPAVTMHVAKTPSATAEREFPRYRKVTAEPTGCCRTGGACSRRSRSVPGGTLA